MTTTKGTTEKQAILMTTTDYLPYRYEVLGLMSTVETYDKPPTLHAERRGQKVSEALMQAYADLTHQAMEAGGNAVIGLRVTALPQMGNGELVVTGTAIRFLDK